MQAVLDDYRTAPLDAPDKALFAFIEKMNEQSNQIRRDDIDAVKAAGWSDEAVYDAITVCALFRFFNAWIDATGVHDMPAAAYEVSGKRLATQGYTPAAQPSATS
ncbi:MAG: carboxymuconolactone decarboxylase family protein [Vicinamibacterales bacterium]